MICTQCGTTNDAAAAFCKNCGMPLHITATHKEPENSKVINLFTAYLGLGAFQSLFYVVVSKWMVLSKDFGTDKWKKINMIESTASWIFNIAGVVLLVMLINAMRQSKAKTWVIIITVIHVVVAFVWLVLPLLEKSSPY